MSVCLYNKIQFFKYVLFWFFVESSNFVFETQQFYVYIAIMSVATRI